jgi:hypothetical protein
MTMDHQVRTTHQVPPQVMTNDAGMRVHQAPQMVMNDPNYGHHHQSTQMMMNEMGMRVQQPSPQFHQSMHQSRRPVVQERPIPSSSRHPVPISAEELLANSYDHEEGRLKVAQIYNQICAAVNENEGDAIQAYGGNKSAGLRVRKALREIEMHCVDMRNALFDQPLRKATDGRRKKKIDGVEGSDPAVEGVLKEDLGEGQSDDALDDLNEDYDREVDSDVDCDTDLGRPSSTPPTERGNGVHEYQFLKKDSDVGGEHPWPHGLNQTGVRIDLNGQMQVPTPPPVYVNPSPQYGERQWPPAVVHLDRD